MWWQRWSTLRASALVGHRSSAPLEACPMTSPLTAFFCLSNVRDAKVADRISASVAVRRLSLRCPRNSWTSLNSNGVDSDVLMAYSPGLRRKKNAIQIMSAMARFKASSEATAMVMMRRRTGIGTGLTLFGAGSSLEYALSMRVIRKSTCPDGSRRGSGAPIARYVCATDRM